VGNDKGEGPALPRFRSSGRVPGREFLALSSWMLRAATAAGLWDALTTRDRGSYTLCDMSNERLIWPYRELKWEILARVMVSNILD